QEKWWIPVRYTNLDDNSNWEKSYLSDLYFADVYKYEDGKLVFEDWDSNGNGKYAEWTALSKDILDLVPDVYVGRLACRTSMEVKNMVNKIIEYENSNAMQQDWFKRMILVGGDSYNDKHGYIEGEIATWEAYKNMQEYGFEAVKVWASEVDLNGDTIGGAINGGAGFAYFCGHGNPMSWSTHRPHDFNSWCHGFNIFDMVTKLKNKRMYPVVIIGGCHNSQFNVSIFNSFSKEKRYKGENAPECWSWVFMRSAEKGAIATIGNTALGYHGDEDSNNNSIPDYIEFLDGWLEINFFKNYGKSLGEMHGDTLASYVNTFNPMKYIIDCKVVEEWLLMGDPSLKIGGYAS
ncbi:MAG: peptidase C25, partial [Thermoplasmata archaeon]|nr:peptidase C25 [Thermoplasmata archaeon]